jgi:hypothetical protein
MHSSLALRLKSMADWRQSVDRSASALANWLREHELYGDAEAELLDSLHERLQSDKLLLAFVAEFSRGKSELINAIFFGDAGRRMLPATPGRTTMCPVELRFDASSPPMLSLLPIATRLHGLSLADLRGRDEPWARIRIDPGDPEGLQRALAEVTRKRRASLEEARALGLWSDERPEDNPRREDDGTVEVPVWRHAIINYPHPLLQRGLVVVDTPGLNAIGAEPELTLGLLPAAHAVVFVLGADTGVTRSDLEIWRNHLGARALERYVVLNKIDTLVDPLLSAEAVQAQIEHQRETAARTLEVDVERVFPLSAREGLASRLAGDVAGLVASRLPDLEAALSAGLLPGQHELLSGAACETLSTLRNGVLRRLADRRRQTAEEMLELRGLRGKSGSKVRAMHERVEVEMRDFERCTARLAALKAVHMKMLGATTRPLSSDLLRVEVAALPPPGMLSLQGTRRGFELLCVRLREALAQARTQAAEMRQMIEASFQQLNAEYGFALAASPTPSLERQGNELDQLERNYQRFFGVTQAWRMTLPGATEHFRRMLLSRLRTLFESAAGELEGWSRSIIGQADVQLRERRRSFGRRHEALERIQQAAGELEKRIAEVEGQEARLRELQHRLEVLLAEVQATARAVPEAFARRDAA